MFLPSAAPTWLLSALQVTVNGASTSTHYLPPKVLHPLGNLLQSLPLRLSQWPGPEGTASNPTLYCAFSEAHDTSLARP